MAISEILGVVCCGNVVFDVAAWPVENLDWNTTSWVESITEGIGGNGANTSYALAKLGIPVRLLSIIGTDERGSRALQILDSVGVDTTSVRRDENEPTSTTVVLIDRGGDRKFLHRPGASRNLAADDVEVAVLPRLTHFHLANPFAFPTLRNESGSLMRRAREAGLTTSIDTGWDSKGRWMMDLGSALPYTDLLFVNDAEARLLGGSDDLENAVGALHKHGVRDIVVKTGARGCSIYTPDVVLDVPGFKAEAIDSTGAGDCFAGAFLAGIARGMNYRECATLANAVGAMNVEHIGAITGVRSFEETQLTMRSRKTS
jgi:sugar/nucleoside kinase (ribokinase family)